MFTENEHFYLFAGCLLAFGGSGGYRRGEVNAVSYRPLLDLHVGAYALGGKGGVLEISLVGEVGGNCINGPVFVSVD